jgi:hypothetical protein
MLIKYNATTMSTNTKKMLNIIAILSYAITEGRPRNKAQPKACEAKAIMLYSVEEELRLTENHWKEENLYQEGVSEGLCLP